MSNFRWKLVKQINISLRSIKITEAGNGPQHPNDQQEIKMTGKNAGRC